MMASNARKRFGLWLGWVAAALAAVSALLSIAPFTPAIVLTALTLPGAVAATWLGARRLGVFGFYWIVLAFIAFPTITPSWLEVYVVIAYPLGLVLGVALYLHYRKSSASTERE
ncbi:MAG: hypothetical protein HKN70_14015 [Gammaproteobacteria bacterium]|nr:hypothetical protein [Gammaproteobacteria bacterium]